MGQLMAAKGSTSTRQNDKTDEYVLQSLASQGYKLNDEYSVAISALLFLVSHFEDQTRRNSIHYFYRPLGPVGNAKAGSSLMTWTAWVQFPPYPDADYLLC